MRLGCCKTPYHWKGLGDADGFGPSMGKAVHGLAAVLDSLSAYHAADGVQFLPCFMDGGRKRECLEVLSSWTQLLSWGISGTSELALQQLFFLDGLWSCEPLHDRDW